MRHKGPSTADLPHNFKFFRINLLDLQFHSVDQKRVQVCPAITTVYSKATLNMANSSWCCNKRCLDNGLQLLGWFCYSHSFTNWFSMILIVWKQKVPQPHKQSHPTQPNSSNLHDYIPFCDHTLVLRNLTFHIL